MVLVDEYDFARSAHDHSLAGCESKWIQCSSTGLLVMGECEQDMDGFD
jgi:hypothetical protein